MNFIGRKSFLNKAGFLKKRSWWPRRRLREKNETPHSEPPPEASEPFPECHWQWWAAETVGLQVREGEPLGSCLILGLP